MRSDLRFPTLLRFAVLIILTVALLDVAFRIDGHSAGRSSAPPRPSVSTNTSSPSSGPSSTDATTPTATAPGATTPAAPRRATPATKGAGGARGTAGTTGTTGRPGATGTTGTLPVTGWPASLRLGALAFVLIAGGALAVRLAGPRHARSGR